MYLLPQNLTKIIANNQHNLGKLGRFNALLAVSVPITRMVCIFQ